MDYTRVQHVGISNHLKVSYLSNYPEYILEFIHERQSENGSGNFTFYSTSGVDPLAFDSSIDCKPPPKDDLHSQTDKKETTNMHLIYKSWVRCYNKS
jgi:hypothetical protein